MNNYPYIPSHIVPPWHLPEPRTKTFTFEDQEENQITVEAVEDGDSVLLYIGEREVTNELRAMLGKEWFRSVEEDLCEEFSMMRVTR